MKKTLAVLSLVLALAAIAITASAQTIVPRTTLAAAITSSSSQANVFRLTSTTGIVAGNVLFIEGEADNVTAVNGSTVTVVRGAAPSTRVSQHPNGAVVWYGPPSYFQYATPSGYPFGSCSRTNGLILPWIDIKNNVYSDCLGGFWIRGQSNALPPTVVYTPPTGGAVLTGVGTSTTTTNTSMYCSEINIPYNKVLTGLRVLNGTAVGNGNRLVALYDAAGNLLANSATAGAATATASQFQAFNFTSTYFAVGPARYFGCSQAANSSDSLNLVVTADGNAGLLTQIYTGQTFGTLPATITPSVAYTTAQGPYWGVF